ncbi:MAG: 2-dehydropantoate 2-reductase [Lachnospiraceae bacterium]|nr:2-dehydropantoate 2-reductase [Lachnospiraceae bacterium]
MEIRTAAIIGAGAIGGYFVWGLSDKMGGNLWVIADGERKARLEKEGLQINGENFELHVRTPKEARGVDLLLIATKYGALKDVLDDIATIVDEHTVVLSLLNGVDSEEIIGGKIGMDRIVYSLMKIAAERVGNKITFNGEVTPGLFYGEAGQKEPSERMLAIAGLLDGTRLHYHMCEDIIRDLWYKYAVNVSGNQPQAILGCGGGAYEDSVYVAQIRNRLREEVVAVAAAKGIDISEENAPAGKSSPIAKRARYSTLQDLDAKRHTEVDIFAGAMVRMGKELGIPTPYNEFAYNAIKALEEKNDGKFDY